MAVSIDDVYQKVLSLANKEQRGYITPQEFNLIANKAQREIYNSYFHQLKMAYWKQKNQMGVAFDNIEMIQEKLHPFKISTTFTQEANDATYQLPEALYSIDVILKSGVEITEMSKKEIAYTEKHPLTKATNDRMIYVRENMANGYPVITLYPTPTTETTYDIHYYKEPSKPKWAYVVVNENALYNTNLSTNFELHVSEEENIVTRILQLAGVITKNADVVQSALMDKANTKQEENN